VIVQVTASQINPPLPSTGRTTMSSACLIRSLAAERDALRTTTQQQMERLQRAERKLRELESMQQREALEQVQSEGRKAGPGCCCLSA
jgi:hypothetical protein